MTDSERFVAVMGMSQMRQGLIVGRIVTRCVCRGCDRGAIQCCRLMGHGLTGSVVTGNPVHLTTRIIVQSALISLFWPQIHTGPAGANNYCTVSDWCRDFIHAVSGGSIIILMLEIFLLIVVGLYIIQKVSDR